MKIKKKEEIEDFLKNIAEPMDIEVVEAVFKMSKNPSLTVYIDKEGGVDLNTCEQFHRAIDEPLDEFDFSYGQPYTLNVSSLGLDRPLTNERDFLRNIGKEVEFKLYTPIKGKKQFEGILKEFNGNSITVTIEEEDMKFGINQITKITKSIRV
jgi:ribosome maturation factor RimP